MKTWNGSTIIMLLPWNILQLDLVDGNGGTQEKMDGCVSFAMMMAHPNGC